MQTDNPKPEQAPRSLWFAITVTIIVGMLFLPVFWIATLFLVDVIWIKFGARPQVVIVDPKEEQQKQQDKVQW